MRRSTHGFTLIELLIVIVIIGILAAIAVPKFTRTRSKGYVATVKSDIKNLISAQLFTATHSGLVGFVACGVFVGSAAPPNAALTVDGEVDCW